MEGALFATTPASNKVNFAALEFFSYFLCKFPTSISVRRPRCYYFMLHNCRVNAFDDQSTVNEFSLFILHLQKLAKITAFMTSLPRFFRFIRYHFDDVALLNIKQIIPVLHCTSLLEGILLNRNPA